MTNSPFTTIALIVLMVAAFYFLILRPQKKRQQAQQKTMNELTAGTRVLLGSGLFGTLTWVGTKQATLEIAPGVELTVLKQSIARVVTPGDEYAEPDEIDEPADPFIEEPAAELTDDSVPAEDPGPDSRLRDAKPLPATPVSDESKASGTEPTANGPTPNRD
jgi:preprotein translocase subunit YajC